MNHQQSLSLIRFLTTSLQEVGISNHVYVVGGAVRNFLLDPTGMKYPIKDIDLVVDSLSLHKSSVWVAEQISKRIPVETSITTNTYGVAILHIKGDWNLSGHDMSHLTIEIAEARKESYGGSSGKGYKPSEVDRASLLEDSVRRDTNYNTLLWRMENLSNGPSESDVIDLTGKGVSDLRKGIIDTPKDPDKTFRDDPTRILRCISAVSKYGFVIPSHIRDAIRRNASAMKDCPWEAIGTLLVENILKEKNARSSLALMDHLGIFPVIREMVQESKPFQTYLAGHLRDKDVPLLLDLMDLGLPVKSPVSFLTEGQRTRLREITVSMDRDDALSFLKTLTSPPIDRPAIFAEFNLKGADRSLVDPIAREIILKDISIAEDPQRLMSEVRWVLSLAD